jgi:tripartite-type tricarboxylate transporter receptor subunit TctC
MNVPGFPVLAALLGAVTVTAAAAQEADWPPEQMRIVISHDIGSSQNQTTRVLGDIWAEKLGTSFIYENRDGASGRIGYDFFLQQPADGSTLLSSNLGSASIMYAQQKPDWVWEEVLHPVGVFHIDPGVLFVRRDAGYETFQDVIDAAKEQPLTLGISFWASPENLQVHQIMDATGAQFEVIPVESSGELVTQILGGHIDIGYNKAAIVGRGGENLKVIAVPLAENPIPHLTDDAPTVDEALGIETLGIASYRAILANKEWAEANPEHAATLRETFVEATEDPRFIEAMERLEVDPELVVALDAEQIDEQVLSRYWDAFERFGNIYSQ